MSTTAAPSGAASAGAPDFAASLSRLAESGVRYAAARVAPRLDRATRAVEDNLEPEGVVEGAAVGAVQAGVSNANPVWAAVKGAWTGADAKTRVVAVVALVVLLLLAPLILAVGLLVLLVAGIVVAIRNAVRGSAT